MDDTNQKQTPIQSGQTPQSTQPADASQQVSQQPTVSQPTQPTPTQPVDQPAPVQPEQTPVSGPAKEQAPIEAPVSEYVQPTEQQPVLAPEVKEAGVEHAPSTERPQVPTDAKQAGVEHAKESVPVMTQPTGNVQVPAFAMTPEEVKSAVKGDVRNAKTWYAKITEFVMKQLNIPLG